MKIAERIFKPLFEDNVVAIHDPVNPAEIYRGDSIKAQLLYNDAIINASVYRLSPMGVEILVNADIASNISIGEETSLNINIAGNDCNFSGIKVASIKNSDENTLLGFRWCTNTSKDSIDFKRRLNTRWLCGEHYLPTGIAANPARFNDYIYFSVIDISNDGLQLSTSMRNKFLIPGMVLDANISFPLVGEIKCAVKIVNTRISSKNGKDVLSVGAKFVDIPNTSLQAIGQYLLQFGPGLTAKDLRNAGWEIQSVDKAINYSYVKSADDYREVLKLRHKTYSEVGKANPDDNAECMSDMFDTQSRILIAKHNGKTVGSLRITFHTSEEKTEYDQFVTFPDNFVRKDEMVVSSRVCTDKNYRGSDLVHGLIRQLLIVTLQSKRRYILGGCSESLLPLYKKLGFKPTGLLFEHQQLKGVKEQVVIADVFNILSGADVDALIWNNLYSDLSSYLSNLHDIPFDPSKNLRLAVYKGLSPFSKAINFFTKWKTTA